MSDPKPPTPPPSRAASRQQVFVGFGVLCLASLMFQAVFSILIAANNDPTNDQNPITNDTPVPSGAGLSKAQLQSILASIAELSNLIKESTASLHENLDGITCVIGRRPQEFNGPDLAASLIGTLSVMVWFLGLGILTDGLYKISTTLRNRVWGCGILGANVGLAYLMAMPPPENWTTYFAGTLWPMYIGMLGGLYSDRGTFLAE